MSTSIPLLMLILMAPALGIDGERFTLDGKPAFLLGISYYGALGIEDEAIVADDLDRMKACGFNWARVFATWDAHGQNISAVGPDGAPREPYMGRLARLVDLAGERGMIVDVSLARGDTPGLLPNQEAHLAAVATIAEALRRKRNAYIDVANERNISDARHVPIAEVRALIETVKLMDQRRLCAASMGGDISEAEARELIAEGNADFLAPHRGRGEGSPAKTAGETRRMQRALDGLRRAPIHYQEPFRRDYGGWQPTLEDFQTDLEQARIGGAAGWCLHNGSAREAPEGRPRRSFDLRPGEPRLFDQFDEVERAFLEWLKAGGAGR